MSVLHGERTHNKQRLQQYPHETTSVYQIIGALWRVIEPVKNLREKWLSKKKKKKKGQRLTSWIILVLRQDGKSQLEV